MDSNRDGRQDVGETPIPGVVIDLHDSTTGAYITSTTTNGSGLYLFDGLPLNVTYTVQLSQVNFLPGGALYPYTATLYLGGASFDNTDSNANPNATFNGFGYAVTTTLTPMMAQDLTLDFGFYAGRIGDYVWVDSNRDGLQDAGETPMSGVVVDLYDNVTGAYITSTTTNGSGLYLFDDLPLNVTYTVQLSQVNFLPGGALHPYTATLYLGGTPFDNTDSNANPDAMFNGFGYAVTTTLTWAITEDLTLDYGFYAGLIGDYVWYEVAPDGLQGTGIETPVPGVVVDLYDSATGAYITSTVTNGSGYYLFDNLPLNVTYTVQLSQVNFLPGGALYQYTATLYLGGAPFDNTDSNANPTAAFNGFGYAVTTTLTTVITQDLTLDFGFTLAPGIELVKSVTPGEVVRGMFFTYTIRITNTGQMTFTTLALTDTLPPEFHYVGGTGVPTDPDVIAEPLLVWINLGSLNPGASIAVSFGVTATQSITGTYINTATAVAHHPGGVLTDTDHVPVILDDPRVILVKQLTGYDRDDVAPNYVTFTIFITNVGVSVIDVLPLLDQYDPYYLSFVRAEPMPDRPEDDGLLTWYDLTAPPPHGFGRNLAPGEGFHVTTVFSVAHDITSTVNTAVITGATDIHHNPTNWPTDTVPINNTPTAVELLYFRVDRVSGQQVRLAWATAVEIDNLGFNLYRADANDVRRAALTHFEPAAVMGGRLGATYVYTDTVPSDGVWWYWLADVDTGGVETRSMQAGVRAEVNAALRYRVYLPVVFKRP